MSFSKCSLFAIPFVVLLGSTVRAEVSADDIWADVQNYAQSLGFQVNGTASRSADKLTISDIDIFGKYIADQGSTQLLISSLSFVENGDGSVSVLMPDTLPLISILKDQDGNQATSTTEYAFEDLDITASGDPDQLRYEMTAAAITSLSKGFQLDGSELEDDFFSVEFSLNNLSGTTTVTIAETRSHVQDFQAESMNYEMIAKKQDGEDEGRVTGDQRDVSFTGTTEMPLSSEHALDFNAMLDDGLYADGTLISGPTAVRISSSETDVQLQGTLISAASNLNIRMGPDGLSYSGQQSDLQVTLEPGVMPFPVSFGVETVGGNLSIPLQKSDAPSDFAFGLNLDGVTLNDAVWALVDPEAQLPRDPATVLMKLSGTVQMLTDLLDPTAIGDADTTPGTLESAQMEEFKLAFAGAELTGNGSFTFDNSDPAAPPIPLGGFDVRLDGANSLLDRLVAIRILPEEQAMAARLMLGLLAVPRDEPDSLSSRIEINEFGHVLANGQRIQ